MRERGRSEAGGDLAALREQNARRLLSLLLEEPSGLTQMAITDRTGLARSTVSLLLSKKLRPVLGGGTHQEDGQRGRPATAWTISPDAAYTVGVDIGRSHVGVCLLDAHRKLTGPPMFEHIGDTARDPQATLKVATRLLKEVVGSRARCERVAAVTVGLPDAVETSSGGAADATMASWDGIDVRKQILRKWPSLPAPHVIIENDANLGAIAESKLGASREAKSLLFIKWSTGVGCGLILDGRLWRGSKGLAGQLGHLAVAPSRSDRRALDLPSRHEAPLCQDCHQVECLETVASGSTVARAVRAGNLAEVLRLAEDEQAARHERARAALQAAARLIGSAVGPALAILNAEVVVLGGLAGRQASLMVIESLEQGLAESMPPGDRYGGRIQASDLGPHTYAIGAALLAFDERSIPFLLDYAEHPDASRATSVV